MNRTDFTGDSISSEDGVMSKRARYSPEVRERAVWMVFEHQADYDSKSAALNSLASKIGCTAETLSK